MQYQENFIDLDFGKCIKVRTDRAAGMVGCHSGATKKIGKVTNKNLLSTHYIIHRKHLTSQKLLTELNDVMIRAVDIINYICDGALHIRLFEPL